MDNLIYQEQCLSTNDEILSFLLQNKSNYFGLYTLNQTNGRGQYGNSWDNFKDKNLAFTIALKNDKSLLDTLINFCTAVFVREFLAKLTDTEVKIKWPNDIIINQKKVAGILLEKKKINNNWYYIIGIGLNILSEKFDEHKKAGSLFTQTGTQFNPKTVASELFQFLKKEYESPLNFDEILKQFNDHLFRKNEISVFEKNKVRQNGIIQNMDSEGFLWIDLENEGLQKFFHKEITMLY